MEHLDAGGITRIPISDRSTMYPDDAYPKIIRDQREMYGHTFDTAEQVWAFWVEYLAGQRQPKEPIRDQRHVKARIEKSRWVARCPNCDGGIACWDQNPYGCCLDCAHVYEVDWQPPKERAAAIRVLAGRPAGNRFWDGETVEQLIVENTLMMGVDVAERHELLVASNVHMPDDLDSAQDYLERLRIEHIKGPGAWRTPPRPKAKSS